MNKKLAKKIQYSKYFIISFLIIIIDQLTKFIFNKVGDIKLFSFFNIIIIENTGASFGVLRGNLLFLIIVSSLASIFLGYVIINAKEITKIDRILFACILGGSIGNLIDRVFRQKVIDFLYFSHGAFSFPAFNIADMAISIGAILLIIINFKSEFKIKHRSIKHKKKKD